MFVDQDLVRSQFEGVVRVASHAQVDALRSIKDTQDCGIERKIASVAALFWLQPEDVPVSYRRLGGGAAHGSTMGLWDIILKAVGRSDERPADISFSVPPPTVKFEAALRGASHAQLDACWAITNNQLLSVERKLAAIAAVLAFFSLACEEVPWLPGQVGSRPVDRPTCGLLWHLLKQEGHRRSDMERAASRPPAGGGTPYQRRGEPRSPDRGGGGFQRQPKR